jgi:hypothetical protein
MRAADNATKRREVSNIEKLRVNSSFSAAC